MHAGLLPRATFVEMGTTMINNTVMAVEDVASCENFTLQLHVSGAFVIGMLQ